MFLTLFLPLLFRIADCKSRSYNALPEVDHDVLRRILPHADPKDVWNLVWSINNSTNTSERKDMVYKFIFTDKKFGEKMSRTVSPFDDVNYVLHKLWSLLDQRDAMVRFFNEANRQLQQTITMGLASELFELFYVLDKRHSHLFPAAAIAWSESITITLSYVDMVRPQDIVEHSLITTDPDAAFHLLYWQLYDMHIETNVLFLPCC